MHGTALGFLRLPGPGDVVGGKYLVERVVGAGGMGLVLAARHLELRTWVALKFMQTDLNDDTEMRARFLREARSISQLQTEHIVRLHDIGWIDDRLPYLVMEYLDGQDLSRVLAERGPLPIAEAARHVQEACRGLAEAHALGIVHRDIKPANLFLASRHDGRRIIKVLDFGIAKTLFGDTADGVLQTAGLLGSLRYCAPEQLGNSEEVSARTDIYSLGVVLYELVTAGHPFRTSSLPHLFSDIVGARPRPLRVHTPDVPEVLEHIVEQCLAKRPSDRFDTVSDLARALDELVRSNAPIDAVQTPHEKAAIGNQLGKAEHRASWSESPSPISAATALARLPARAFIHIAPAIEMPGCCQHLRTGRTSALEVRFQLVHDHVDSSSIRTEQALQLAASELKNALAASLRHALLLCFVVEHSCLAAVKLMLCQDFEEQAAIAGGVDGAVRTALLLRTEHLIEVLPDKDCSPEAAWPRVDELNPALQRLETRWRTTLALLQAEALPIPRWVTMPAEAFVDTTSDNRNTPAVRRAATYAAGIEGGDLFVEKETLIRVYEFNRAAAVRNLVEHEPDEVESARLRRDHFGGTQRQVYERLVSVIGRRGQPTRWVVTGQPGVGKSTVLRALASRLSSVRKLVPEAGPLPFTFLLPLVTLSPNETSALSDVAREFRGRLLFSFLLWRWSVWAERAEHPRLITPEYVEAAIRSRETVLVFDGVDEFLMNNRGLTLQDFQDLIDYLTTVLAESGRISVVLGVRSSLPGYGTLATSREHVLEVERLSIAEAVRRYPETASVLASITDREFRSLLLTPLVLSWIGPRMGRLAQTGFTSAADLLEEALSAIVDESRLPDLRSTTGVRYAAEEWLAALSVLGWIFFSGFLGELRLDQLLKAVEEIDGRSPRGLEPIESRLIPRALEVLRDPDTSGALLRRTIFFPAGRSSIRFMHRQWQDFLAARYFALCIEAHHVDELGYVGLSLPMFKMAGDVLHAKGLRVDGSLASAIIDRSRGTGRALIAANFVAFLASSRIPMDGRAIDVTLRALEDMKPLTRLITLNGLSYRALRNDDPAAPDLRARLAPIYWSCISGKIPFAPPGSVLCSIAWCHLKAFSYYFGDESPRTHHPALAVDPSVELLELQVLGIHGQKQTQLSVESRSVQVAFLQAQQAVLGDSYRPISVVHYLYYLVLARRYGYHISEISAEFPTIFAPDGPTREIFNTYLPVPELCGIFDWCRALAAQTQTVR